jgi:cleavage and polyadenylation specificity factor subunit 1
VKEGTAVGLPLNRSKFTFKFQDLYGVAFIDSQIYIHQLCSIKNFILVGDVVKSVDLLEFQQDYRTLAVISRDSRNLEVYATEFLVDNRQLGFLVTDADKNLIVYSYEASDAQSLGGQKLIRAADCNVGQHINCIFRIRAKITDPTTGGRIMTGWEKRQVSWFGTLDGALGYVLPISARHFGRLKNMINIIARDRMSLAGGYFASVKIWICIRCI